MVRLLERELSQIASKIVSAETSFSQYFTIGCIKVRISDHFATSSDYDLAIFRTGPGYTAIPAIGNFKEVKYFTNVSTLIDYIIDFEYFARIFVKAMCQIPEHVEHQKECLAKKAAQKAVETASWKVELKTFTTQKSPSLLPLFEDIFRITPEEEWKETIESIKKHAGETAQNRFNSISAIHRIKMMKYAK